MSLKHKVKKPPEVPELIINFLIIIIPA